MASFSELPYKIPKGLDDNTTKKRKRKTEIKKELLPINEVVDKGIFTLYFIKVISYDL